MPYDTLEVRWFFEATSLPNAPEVEAWFRSRASADPAATAGEKDPPEWRTDSYLIVPGTDDLGIKLREGRFEVKGKVRDLGTHAFGPRASGRIERWMKWSCDIEAKGNPTIPDGGWLTRACHDDGVLRVPKQRLLKTFHIDDSGAPVSIAAAERDGASTVDFELTRIRLGNGEHHTHWTMGFEAPYGSDLPGAFRHAVAELLRDWPGPPLAAEASFSYAGWLPRLRSVPPAAHG